MAQDKEFTSQDVEGDDHHVELENTERKGQRPFSIDLSLQLERQLALEDDSMPNTPANPPDSIPKRESLDPQVLAHIIMQLRQSLAEMTKERDDLVQQTSTTRELQDALQHMTVKATSLEEELSEAKMKIKDDEEAISLLRTKVEESRRGLMRLQTESRRQSQSPSALDLSRAGISFAGTPSTKSAKRASFTPLTGSTRPNSHKRGSSISDSGLLLGADTSPSAQSLALPDVQSSNGVSRRLSGMFGRTGSSPPPDHATLTDRHAAEVDALKKELKEVRDTVEELRHELSEAHEAKEASETCAKALREFIAEHQVGTPNQSAGLGDTVKLPGGEEADAAKSANSGGWGFKLWKVDTSVKPSGGPTSPSAVTSPNGAPLAKKIGGFFSSRATVSGSPAIAAQPPLQSNASGYRDSMYSFSDKSSMVEPVSPTGEVNSQVEVVGCEPEVKGGIAMDDRVGKVLV